MNTDLRAIGLDRGGWRATIEAAIGTDRLSVVGEPRGGQLVRYDDPSGAQLYILGVEPYSTYAGFTGRRSATAHVTAVDDVLALVEVLDDDPASPDYETAVAALTCNLAQGPLIVDAGTQSFEQVALTALAVDAAVVDADGADAGEPAITATGAQPVLHPDGTRLPDASARIRATVRSAERRVGELGGQAFWLLDLDLPVPMDVCLPAGEGPGPAAGDTVAGLFQLVGEILAPAGCGDGGCGSGGCGSGGCGCGG